VRRGISLLELLLSMTIVVLVVMASTRAYVAAIGFESHLRSGRDAIAKRNQFEDTVTNLLHHAWLSATTTDQNSYFIGGMPTVLNSAGGTTGTTGSTSTSSSLSSGAGGASGSYGTPNTMVFTAAGLPVPDSYLASNDDFQTLNQTFGPVGGIQEIELSQNAVGAGGQGKSGLFMRVQIPADDDPTQGGNEQLLSPDISQLGFEFFDGQNWDQSWDSRVQAPHRLPAAIRVTYRMKGDDVDHIFIVMVPASDITYLNPVTVTG
jgi:hypothetical protein